jgi:hypothetical protein
MHRFGEGFIFHLLIRHLPIRLVPSLICLILGCDIMCALGSLDSGIEGEVIIRPLRPIESPRMVSQRPYSATITVLQENGQFVTEVQSDSDGHFRVTLQPGTYILSPKSTSRGYPHARKQTITVSDRKFTQVRIEYDSGIR